MQYTVRCQINVLTVKLKGKKIMLVFNTFIIINMKDKTLNINSDDV